MMYLRKYFKIVIAILIIIDHIVIYRKQTLDIKCLSRYEAFPFNQKDSLISFQLYINYQGKTDTMKIFLSKKFGFIQYVPF